jgi:hypothetical protein
MAWTIITLKRRVHTYKRKKNAFMATTMKTTSKRKKLDGRYTDELRLAAIYAPALSAAVFS